MKQQSAGDFICFNNIDIWNLKFHLATLFLSLMLNPDAEPISVINVWLFLNFNYGMSSDVTISRVNQHTQLTLDG